MEEKIKLRDKLADIALQWQASFGVAPSITSSISEYDAAMLIGMSEKEYSNYMRDKTAFSAATITSFFLITLRLGSRRLRRSKHLFLRKRQKQKSK